MQDSGSRYLVSLRDLEESIAIAIESGTPFESLKSNVDDLPDSVVEITQDDGGGSALLLADLLNTHQVKATFFIITSKIGTKNYLNADEILSIKSMGHRIGSHSDTHPSPFCDLSDLEIHNEVLRSKELLQNLLNVQITTFSVPGGETRRRTLEILSNPLLGMRRVYTSTPYRGIYRKLGGVEFAGRLCIERSMSISDINKIILGKSWVTRRLDYQARRFRREILYKFRHFLASSRQH